MTGTGRRSRYFYLSYAHSPPVPGQAKGELDHWVKRFFEELSAAVETRRPPGSDLDEGWYDQKIPLNTDRRTEIGQALETARVFVPLYSPGYFNRLRTGQEWACFHDRVRTLRPDDPLAKMQPVLWAPVRSGPPRPGFDRALEFGSDIPDYRTNGLQGMLRLKRYRTDYQRLLGRLADKIVALAHNDPIPPSAVANPEQIRSTFDPDRSTLTFSVLVVAPPQDALSAEAPERAYGKDVVDWRPFDPEQTRPLSVLAADQAERLDFSGRILPIGPLAVREHTHPGVVLVDPWFLALDDGPERLDALLSDLPPWVLPMVISAPADPRSQFRKTMLLEKAKAMVAEVGSVGSDPVLTAATGVESLQAFLVLMPFMVAEAERHYLRHFSRRNGDG